MYVHVLRIGNSSRQRRTSAVVSAGLRKEVVIQREPMGVRARMQSWMRNRVAPDDSSGAFCAA